MGQQRTYQQQADLANQALEILRQQVSPSGSGRFSVNGVLRQHGMTNAEACAANKVLRELGLLKRGPKQGHQFLWHVNMKTGRITGKRWQKAVETGKLEDRSWSNGTKKVTKKVAAEPPEQPGDETEKLLDIIAYLEAEVEQLKAQQSTTANVRAVLERYEGVV